MEVGDRNRNSLDLVSDTYLGLDLKLWLQRTTINKRNARRKNNFDENFDENYN